VLSCCNTCGVWTRAILPNGKPFASVGPSICMPHAARSIRWRRGRPSA
jgi:hypothetical protein